MAPDQAILPKPHINNQNSAAPIGTDGIPVPFHSNDSGFMAMSKDGTASAQQHVMPSVGQQGTSIVQSHISMDVDDGTAIVNSSTSRQSNLPNDTIYISGREPSPKLHVSANVPASTAGTSLDKGKPAIRRGSRPSKLSDGGSLTASPVPLATQSPLSAPITPLTPNTTKRKRTESNVSHVPASSVTSSQSRESTPEYNPTSSQTRSGRHTQRPVSIITVAASSGSPAPKRTNSNSTSSTPNLKTHPKIKRRVYKGKEQFALCEHCLRSYGPPSNVIVFCDACNKCWHQRCHNPQISKDLVADTKAEWFCAACDKILHGNKKAKKNPTSDVKPEIKFVAPPPPPPPPPVQQYGLPIVGAVALSMDQQRAYLNTLSKDRLINIILKAGSLAPQLPMFETPLPPPLPLGVTTTPVAQRLLPQFASNYVTPVDPGIVGSDDGPNEVYDDRIDEHAVLYPKPGQGAQLPPDRVDLHMLLEGADSRTFSHWVRGMAVKTYLDNTTLVQG